MSKEAELMLLGVRVFCSEQWRRQCVQKEGESERWALIETCMICAAKAEGLELVVVIDHW